MRRGGGVIGRGRGDGEKRWEDDKRPCNNSQLQSMFIKKCLIKGQNNIILKHNWEPRNVQSRV